MATTRIWAVKNRLDHMVSYVSNQEKTIDIKQVIDYATNDYKTYEKEYVSCINCSYLDSYQSMVNTKKQFNDEREILAFHGYQSFDAGEVDAELAHQIGVEYAKRMWGDKCEVVVATHLNTQHIHNHFLINATSFVDGKRHQNNYKDLYRMREVNDKICKEHGLSIVEKQKYHSKNKNQYFADKSYRSLVKEDVDEALKVSYTKKQFVNEMQLGGYEIKITDNNISVKHACYQKFIRLKSLGNDYTNDAIIDRILDLDKEKPLYSSIYSKKNFDIKPFFTKYQNKQLTGLQRLFLHYQYVLGILPKDNRRSIKYSAELKEAMKHIDEISDQTIFLCKKNISNVNELLQYKSESINKLNELLDNRQLLRNKVRRCNDKRLLAEYKCQITDLTNQIKIIRKEIRLCEGIEERNIHLDSFEKQISKK